MSHLFFISYIVLGFTLIIGIANYMYRNRITKKGNKKPEDILSFDVTNEEYHKILNFMLMYDIITGDQYHQYMSKGAPYTR